MTALLSFEMSRANYPVTQRHLPEEWNRKHSKESILIPGAIVTLVQWNITDDCGSYMCYRFTGGIHNESYDEEITYGVIFALCGSDT
jgi:hypothetical protein